MLYSIAMKSACLLLIGFAVQLPCAHAQSAEQFPYVAYVIGPETYVRGGPGGGHYPTATLAEGFAVEVFRHDSNGWCAIRPPEGSFSWVEARKVRIVGDGTAEILGEQTVARVGSSLSPIRSTVQVLLQRGELVKLAPQVPVTDRNWLAIIAPAGEFRWIEARRISRQPPVENTQLLKHPNTQIPNPQAGWQAQHAGQSLNTQSLNRQPTRRIDAEATHVVPGSPAAAELAQYESSSSPLPPPSLYSNESEGVAVQPPTTNLQPPSASRLPLAASMVEPPTPNHQPPTTNPPRVRFRGLSAEKHREAVRLEELQLRLSQTIINEPQQWQFDALRREADMLFSKAHLSTERTRIRDFQDQITRFDLIRTRRLRQQQNNGPVAEVARLRPMARERADQTLASNDPFDSEDALSDAPNEVRYDAVGLLKPVMSRRKKAPQYALVDDKGEVVSFITPTPDVNLLPYIGKRIGIQGTRGFMPEYRRAHVTASRVTPLGYRLSALSSRPDIPLSGRKPKADSR